MHLSFLLCLKRFALYRTIRVARLRRATLIVIGLSKYVGKRNLKTQKAVAHASRALQLFGFWV